jgi:hypothetical protein
MVETGTVKEQVKEDYAPEYSFSCGCSQTSFLDQAVGGCFWGIDGPLSLQYSQNFEDWVWPAVSPGFGKRCANERITRNRSCSGPAA